jgi:triacylglycerol lipase
LAAKHSTFISVNLPAGSMARFLILLLALLQALASAEVLMPYEDEFYNPPDGDDWKKSDPGTILKQREIELAPLTPDIRLPQRAFQLQFVTTDVYNETTTSVTTVIIPQNANTSRILSYQIAYDAPDPNCSPSYGLQKGAEGPATSWSRNQMFFIYPYLVRNGAPVLNIPDYEGSNAAFTVGPQSAYHTLDSVRAALKSAEYTNVSPEAETILFGYSGGAYATEWASEFHAHYAEDLNIIGAAIGGPPPNITQTYININGQLSTLNVWAMLGVMNAIPRINDSMRDHLLTDYREKFLGPLNRCNQPTPPPEAVDPKDDVSSFFSYGDGFLTEFKDELTDIGVMGRRIEKGKSPNFPLYIYQGTRDNITGPFKDTEDLYHKFCALGTKVLLKKYVGGNHFTTLLTGTIPALQWIKSTFAGNPTNGCRVDLADPEESLDDGRLFSLYAQDPGSASSAIFSWTDHEQDFESQLTVQNGVTREEL